MISFREIKQDRIIDKSAVRDKQQDDSAAGRDRRQTPADFSSIYSKDLLPASHGEELTRGFLQELVNILLGYICKSNQRSSKVLDFHHPHQLKEGLEGFSLNLPDQPETLEQFTYEVSPVFILMEEVLLRKMQSIVGWSDEEGDGIFCPGGTISNLYSILVARYYFYPEVKTRGMGALPQLALFTSEHSHYSVKKSAAVLGLGSENVVTVKCDERWGLVPFYVNATAGTTVYGAFDPFDDVADICHQHTLWMHVDGLLKKCNEMGAEYLFQTDKPYDVSYDTGDKSIQCGRHVDAFKLWLMWKAKGSEGFGAQVDKCLENAEYLYDQLQRRAGFELVFKNKPEHCNVCFWYTPPSLRGLPPGEDRDTRLHQVAPQIKGRMMEKGSVLIGYQPLGAKVNFFRCVFSNPATQHDDIDFLLEEIIWLSHDL
ncbi:Glutamate decarboxylase 1 [Collichthys lucidus]|uniref:Glutamate decarboxylase 1 n=1 Tax=Collichthys lucidus TaxID=240159 RepID=A0A4U5UZJ5_COLLU|nr:Glutamate decarboxylase 1 [Collichthys lucidus]